MPFGSKTGRNQPSNSRLIFGTSPWLRRLIKPGPGRALAYVDWSGQEIAIEAALSGDEALWSAYESGDPCMAFAIQAALAAKGATKETHKGERQRAKAIVLGVPTLSLRGSVEPDVPRTFGSTLSSVPG